MDLLISANTVAKARADTAPVSGTPGWATDGDPAAGIPATDAPAWHYNMMMGELLAIVDAAGIARSNTDWSQVIKALKTIFSPAQYGVAPYSAALATLIGGYPAGAIVYVSGAFWVSTVATNMTVPGASGAKWKSLFDGYATQEWATENFIAKGGTNGGNFAPVASGVTSDFRIWMSYLDKTGTLVSTMAPTLVEFNSLNAALSNEIYTRSSADTALSTSITNEATRATAAEALKGNLSGGNTWYDDQNVNGNIAVGSGKVVSFSDSSGAGSMYLLTEYYTSGNLRGLNAVIHLRNSSGNSMPWMALRGSDGSVWTSAGELAFVSQLPTSGTITGGYYSKIGTILEQDFSISNPSNGTVYSFPQAFSAPPIVKIQFVTSSKWTYVDYSIGNITATGFTYYNTSNGAAIHVSAKGQA